MAAAIMCTDSEPEMPVARTARASATRPPRGTGGGPGSSSPAERHRNRHGADH